MTHSRSQSRRRSSLLSATSGRSSVTATEHGDMLKNRGASPISQLANVISKSRMMNISKSMMTARAP
jgi:hypothetical protein